MSQAFYDAAQRDLPNFPRAVIELWFEHAVSRGESWPPRLDGVGIPASEVWRSVLGSYRFAVWPRVTWTKETVRLTFDLLEPNSALTIFNIMKEFTELAVPKPGVTTPNYRERIRDFVNHLTTTRRLPVPPLLLRVGAQYEVLDGYHRLAALFLAPVLHIDVEPQHEVWVARL